MAIETHFVDWVTETLGAVTPIRIRKMFGGIGVYSGDLFFAIADGKTIYLKVDDTNRPDFERMGMTAFAPFDDEPHKTMSYYPIPPDVLGKPDELKLWVEKALGVAERAKRPRGKRG